MPRERYSRGYTYHPDDDEEGLFSVYTTRGMIYLGDLVDRDGRITAIAPHYPSLIATTARGFKARAEAAEWLFERWTQGQSGGSGG